MANLSDLATSQYLKVLIYSESGCGKTCSLSTMPGPIFVLDFDQKVSSLASYLKHTNASKLKEISYEPFGHDPAKKGRPMQRFAGAILEKKKQIEAGEFKYKTVALDSLTTFGEELMREIVVANPGTKRAIDGIPALQDYLVLSNEFKKYISMLLSLPVNVVVLAHIAYDKDDSNGAVKGVPLLPGKLAAALPVVFPEIYRAFVTQKDGKAEYMLQTRQDGKHITRTQIPGLGAVVKNDLGEIIKELNKEVANGKN